MSEQRIEAVGNDKCHLSGDGLQLLYDAEAIIQCVKTGTPLKALLDELEVSGQPWTPERTQRAIDAANELLKRPRSVGSRAVLEIVEVPAIEESADDEVLEPVVPQLELVVSDTSTMEADSGEEAAPLERRKTAGELVSRLGERYENREGFEGLLCRNSKADPDAMAAARETIKGKVNLTLDPLLEKYEIDWAERRRLFQLVGWQLHRTNTGHRIERIPPQTLETIRKNVAAGKKSGETPDKAEQDLVNALYSLFAAELQD